MYNYLKDNTPLKVLTLYFFLKLFSVLIAYYFNSKVLGAVNFIYNDFHTAYAGCDLRSPNSFFTAFNCLFNIKDISNIYVIVLAYFLSTTRDFIYIIIFNSIISKRYLLILVIIFAIHPYLAIYQARFTTSLFASYAFLLIFIMIRNNLSVNLYFVFIFVFLTGFRNALMPFFIMFIFFEAFKNYKILNSKKITFYTISIISIYLITRIPKADYAFAITKDSTNYFSWQSINNFFSLDMSFISHLLTLPVVFISHFICLLGFRESVFADGFGDLLNFSIKSNFQLGIFITLFFIHFFGIIGFFRFFGKTDIRAWSFIFYFFPTMLFLAHMRYFVPMMPLSILGLVLFFDTIKVKFPKK